MVQNIRRIQNKLQSQMRQIDETAAISGRGAFCHLIISNDCSALILQIKLAAEIKFDFDSFSRWNESIKRACVRMNCIKMCCLDCMHPRCVLWV